MALDPKLREYASARQWELMDALDRLGSPAAARDALGLKSAANVTDADRLVRAKASRAGYAPGHFENGVAPGYAMGKVTVQRSADGTVERTWERQSPDRDEQAAALRAFVDGLLNDGARGASTVVPSPEDVSTDLLTAYLFGDPHFGMRAMKAETGDDFDLAEAERLTCDAIDYMVGRSPPSETGLLVEIGDLLHADDSTNATPASKNPLDVDGRFFDITQVALRTLVYTINRMKTKHAKVVVWIMPGNHDPHASWMLALCLASFFSNDSRVTIDLEPGLYKYFRFGKNLFGAHHGHGAKLNELALIMANDRKEDWGVTDHRIFWMGHIHHKQALEVPGVFVESLNTLAGSDAWHRGKGYRSSRSTQMVVFDAEHGETERHKCNISRLARKAA